MTNIVLEGNRATGVAYNVFGDARRADARAEVVISAGAIQSPQVLMLSGIGDPDELKKHGIDVKHALKGVGQNLQEHISAPVHYMSPLITSYGISLGAMPKIAWNAFLYAFARRGFFANNIVESGGFIRTMPGLDRPDIQHIFVPTHQGKPGEKFSENTRFIYRGIVFVGLNVPGSNNNKVNTDKECTAKSARTAAACAAMRTVCSGFTVDESAI